MTRQQVDMSLPNLDSAVLVPSDRGLLVQDLFEAQAVRTPDAIALIEGSARLSYAALDRTSWALANRLRSEGVGPEVVVGIFLERSSAMMVAMLGVLKAGGAFLLIDPSLPKTRIRYMLADAAPALILTADELTDRLRDEGLPLVTMTNLQNRPSGFRTCRLASEQQLAYVIFTSGSTGRPKGVLGSHAGLLRRMAWMWRHFPYEPEEVCCQKAPTSFVDLIGEVWTPLCQGIPVVVIPDEHLTDPDRLLAQLAKHRVTRVTLVPTLMRMLLNTGVSLDRALPSMKLWTFSGEELTPDLLSKFRRMCRTPVCNTYGASETSIEVTCWSAEACDLRQKVPIGYPMDGVIARVLDERGGPCPPGTIGELYLGGPWLARGYLNQSALTAVRFLPSEDPRCLRLFRTGDLVSYQEDGLLIYHGRLGRQVKISGKRVEPGEIEQVLLAHPAVAEAVVKPREVRGHRSLEAYLIVCRGSEIDLDSLAGVAHESLPAFMVPARWYLMDAFPRTGSGKTDREALVPPDVADEPTHGDCRIPAKGLEAMLAELWAEVLGQSIVDRQAHFFDLGGDSVQVTDLTFLARQRFGLEIPGHLIFQVPVLTDLAEALKAQPVQDSQDTVVCPPETPRAYPMTSNQRRLWFLDQLGDGAPIYLLYGSLIHLGPFDVRSWYLATVDLLRRHTVLRSRFPAENGVPRLSLLDVRATPPFQWLDLSGLDQQLARKVMTAHRNQVARQRLDLDRGPLIRFVGYGLEGDECHLFWMVHHLIGDDWSMNLIAVELATCYQRRTEGLQPRQTGDTSFLDMAAKEASLTEDRHAASLAFWRSQLRPLPPPLVFPDEPVTLSAPAFAGRHRYFRVPEKVTGRLFDMARAHQVTPYMVLMSIYAVVLARFCGRERFLMGTPVANRGAQGTAEMIGFMVHTMVLRFDLVGNPRFDRLLCRVREMVAAAMPHVDVPFEELVRSVSSDELRRRDVFQTMFIYQGKEKPVLGHGFHWADPEIENRASIFDLSLTLALRRGALLGEWEFNDEKLSSSAIGRLTTMLQRLLAAIPECAELPLAKLPLADPRVRTATGVSFQSAVPITQRLQAFAESDPDRAAILVGDRVLTYASLDREVQTLAAHLVTVGLAMGDRVGLLAPRNEYAVIAILAIWRAGGVVVPLYPKDPSERLARIVADSGTGLLVADRTFEGKVHGVSSVYLDEPLTATQPDLPMPPVEGAAYVLYTSGTSGNPKGVAVSHRVLAGHCDAMAKRFGIEAASRVLQFAAFSFDPSFEQMFTALGQGAALLVRDRMWSVDELSGVIVGHAVTHVNLPTAYWRQWTEAWQNHPETMVGRQLHTVIAGGEALAQEGFEAWRKVAGETRLINAYGPTEAVITATTCELTAGETGDEIAIGTAVPGQTALVLDGLGGVAAPGVKGEIFLGGPSLAQGYLNAPALTAAKFLPDPFAGVPGARIYRTGDLAAYNERCELVFHGRVDQQLKVRGFRVEIGEIEAALRQCPQVDEAVILATEAPASDSMPANADPYAVAVALAALETERASRIFEEIAAMSEAEASRDLASNGVDEDLHRQTPALTLKLQIFDPKFIAPPKAFQRNWLLQRTLDECLDDLTHLDGVAKRLIPSAPRPAMQRALSEGEATYGNGQLRIDGQEVMQAWQKPLMERMVDVLCQDAERVLEIGFGMGMAADMIQARGVSSHTIVECNPQVIETFRRWRNRYPHAEVNLVEGKWQDVIDRLPQYDAILFDTFPLDEEEFDETVIRSVTFAEHFMASAAAHLTRGGVFTYYTNEIDSFSRRHQRLLFRHFESFSLSLVKDMQPPPENQNWWADSMVVVKAVK